jgi:hypothetical protein
MVNQRFRPAATKASRAFGVADAGFLGGRDGFSGDGSGPLREQQAGGAGASAASDRAELTRAAGKTATEVEHEFAPKLGAKYLKSPRVTVFVKECNSQRVTVEGAVKKPGVHAIRGHDRLMRAIAKAESLDRETASSNVVVFRTSNGARSAMRFDIDDIRSGGTKDPATQAGDVVVVDASMTKSAFQALTKVLPLAGVAGYVF